jgi:hypothetical protein
MSKLYFIAVILLSFAFACSSDNGSSGSSSDTAAPDGGPSTRAVAKDAGPRPSSAKVAASRDKDDDAGSESKRSEPAAGNGNASASELKAFEKLAGAYCDKLVQCASFGFERSYESGDDCRKRRMQLYVFWAELPDTGWTSDSKDACYKAVYGLSCREFIDDNGQKACAPKGKRKDAEPCNAREQCESRFCAADGYACGTCKKAPDESSSCAEDNDCPDETACLCDNGTPRCDNPHCRRLRDAEEACSEQTPCGAGLNCKSGRCQIAPDHAGAECNPREGVHCDTVSAGLVCTPSGCAKLKPADVCTPTEYCKDRNASCEIAKDSQQAACVPMPDDRGECDPKTGRTCRFPAVCSSGKCQLPGSAPNCK